jgi:hypothetical protein
MQDYGSPAVPAFELQDTTGQQPSTGLTGQLKLVASAMAYYSITSKRIIDVVPLHLKHFLLGRYCSELQRLPGMLIAADLPQASSNAGEAASAVAGSESGSSTLAHKLQSAV